ncbi:Kelch repeat-containing protein [Mycolicibacterium monacense]|uniref:Kelch repeat-containing protein n=1 Tax=Mycolicibacterium monacense TaxID=85693 RepID=UPI001AF28C98|nr:kelch repeat-containing protein [Mycolicibacterium monacense]QHP88074.1 protein kinase [Mycolicibacterium monacense DSM 44395]
MAGGIATELAAAGFTDAVEIGRGGGGVVYRCNQKSLGRSVAIKVLASDLDDKDDRERFLREGYAMGGLSGHPNIVNILQVGVTDGNRPFIVMPYHARGSLAQRVRREGRIAWPEALRIGVKLCGALETAHRTGTLHRDIKPANVLVNDYGEPQLSDFGTARIVGGYKTVTGFFTGTLSYTAPEVLSGTPPTVAADVYSLGATIYALIAGNPPHERKADEDLIAHYLRITSTPVPDLRPEGIPVDVCAAIEKAMSREPADRYASAEEFGLELQLAQRHNGLTADPMALSDPSAPPEEPAGAEAPDATGRHEPTGADSLGATGADSLGATGADSLGATGADSLGATGAMPPPTPGMFAHTASISASSLPWAVSPSAPPPAPGPPPDGAAEKPERNRKLIAAAAALAVLLLVASGVYMVVTPRDDAGSEAARPVGQTQPTQETQPGWQTIADARVARDAVAATEADGTIWVFGGLGEGGRVSGRHEGYDPAIDSWKSGEPLPVPVQHAMAVTWQGTPVVLGGWRTEGANTKVATDRVWRVVNSRWAELPPLLQPRAAASAAVVGERIIVTGGVDASGKVLDTTEIFDGTGWRLGAAMPTPRQMSAAASDDRLVYVVGGTTGSADLATVEAYDPAADTWTDLPPLPQPRSDFGAASADGRLVAVGGESAGQELGSVVALDFVARTWSPLPDMTGPRRGMAVAGVGRTVYAIGGATGDGAVTASAESLKLAARRPQPVAQWRTLPDAPTARLMMAWTVLGDTIWVAGGMSHGESLQTVESYDTRTGTWQPQPPLPIPLHHATAATYRGEVVVLGGATDSIADASNKVFAFRDGAWVDLPPLQHARVAGAAAVVGDQLVVVGGQDDKQLVAQTEVFDGQSWTQAADLPTPREHLAAVSDGVYVYTVGGRLLSADENSAAFERFDPRSGTWESLPDMPTPRGSYGAAFIDGRIVAVGGEEPTRVLATVEMYDIAGRTWSTLTPISTPLHGEAVAAVGSTLYCIGGADRPTHEGPVATVEALDFT